MYWMLTTYQNTNSYCEFFSLAFYTFIYNQNNNEHTSNSSNDNEQYHKFILIYFNKYKNHNKLLM